MIKCNILFVLYFAGLLVSSNTYKLVKNRFDSSHRVFSNKNTQSADGLPSVAVIGFSGGSAEGIANNLQTLGFKVSAILDDDPISPIVKNNVEYFYGDIDKELLDNKGKSFISSSLLKDKLVIVVGDSVPEANDNNDELSFELYRKVSKVLPNNLKGLVCVAGSNHEEDSNLFAKIKGGAGGSGVKVFRKFCSDNSIPLSILKFGKLTGGIPGAEPLPFMGMPLIEPDLHPSYVLQSIVLSSAENKFSTQEPCTRKALSETVGKLITQKVYTRNDFDAQVISLAGKPPSESDWEKLFTRVVAGSNAELVRIDFAEVLKLPAFTNWLADTWFPQALIDADAATILSGARPVKAVKVNEGAIRIIWEDIKPDLSVARVGEIEIRVSKSPACLTAVRISNSVLPGEAQLIERLIEGINKNVYKKMFCSPK